MNRRHFFGMTAAAVVAVGLPLSVLPERTIFLPPNGGVWLPKMRQIEQYLINDDSLRMRWDMAWVTADGQREQAYLLEEPMSGLEQIGMGPGELALLKQHRREFARECLTRKVPRGARIIEVPIPRGIGVYAAHV
jgi:hypothetical protein